MSARGTVTGRVSCDAGMANPPRQHTRQLSLYVCSDCPCCEEGGVEGCFYCRHPARKPEAAEPLSSVFDPPPAWCPIREEHTVLIVGVAR